MAEINIQDVTVKTKEGNTNTYEFVQSDGSYEGMTVGNAEQLVSTVYTEDSVPYNFRTSGGSIDIGDRETDEVVGGTVCWNQLFPTKTINYTGTGYTLTSSNDGKITITVTEETATQSTGANHTSLAANTMIVGHKYAWIGTKSGIHINLKKVAKNADTIFLCSDASYNNVVFVFEALPQGTYELYPQLFDLTAMFGSTIADYIYSLETATAGAGVAWFRKLFPKDYYAYNAGELLSVSGVSAHRMVGFNAYNPETGTAVLLGGNQYQITGTYTALSYTDIGGNAETITPDSNGLFTPSANGTLTVTGGNSTDTCVHLVWSGAHNGEYEPYEVHEYALDDSLTLRGVPKLDANNELYYDGDTYASDGTVTRYWTERAYQDGDVSDGSTMITDGTTTVYKLATPTTETAEPYTNPQIVNDWGTEEYVTDSIVPVGHTTTYGANLRDKLQHLPDLADNDGNYLIQQTGTQMALVPFRIPQATGADGTYVLKVTVSGGTPTYAWVLEE